MGFWPESILVVFLPHVTFLISFAYVAILAANILAFIATIQDTT